MYAIWTNGLGEQERTLILAEFTRDGVQYIVVSGWRRRPGEFDVIRRDWATLEL